MDIQFMYAENLKNEAIRLRKEGYSYNFIASKVNIAVSTLSLWLQNVSYVPNKFTLGVIGRARTASGLKKHELKLESLRMASVRARKDIGKLSNRDLFMLGLAIYIGEGTKTSNITRIINADPKIIRIMLRWFRECCGLESENFKIRLHLYPDNDEFLAQKFWSKETGISLDKFYKSSIDRRIDKKLNKKGRLPYGTAHLSVISAGNSKFGVNLHRLIQAWIDCVLC